MEFENPPQARAVAVFSGLRYGGNVATGEGERCYGAWGTLLRASACQFPLPCRIPADLPAHGGKLGQSLAGLLAALLHGLGKFASSGPDVTGKSIQFHAPGFARIDPAA